jgi:hypothetical protein
MTLTTSLSPVATLLIVDDDMPLRALYAEALSRIDAVGKQF